ncbi:MAG: cell division protein FtsQ/DivIB [Rhodobacteraceae bacterium]|nr:cell division protein FtsQ/DivIB [Paracoccaceae bacterium]MCY4197598.1 cell division protein FtsQ/DivIB [Paracoccaceae bacterium]MCY4327617.1 cell division protein FtsQ/DivIB [Paracoccaceae bacterium]
MSQINRAYQKGSIQTYFRLRRILLKFTARPVVLRALFLLVGSAVAIGSMNVFVQSESFALIKSSVMHELSQFVKRPELQVHQVIVNASPRGEISVLDTLADQTFPVDILSLDVEEIRRRIENLDLVEKASVAVEAGGLLKIDVVEHEPAVVMRRGGKLALLDRAGRDLTEIASRHAYFNLPLLVGQGAEQAVSEALAIHEEATDIQDSVRGFIRIGQRRWDILLDGDRRILLPEEQAAETVRRFIDLEDQNLLLQRRLAHIDLRDSDRIVVAPSAGDDR